MTNTKKPDTHAATGLRERKKARTKTVIQQQALRLFREQGYQATTVEQVAAAAEVAPSTVFRYFPTKEDLATLDDYYPLTEVLGQALEAQPAELNPFGALRGALTVAFNSLSAADRAARYERDLLIITIPELWAANLDLITKSRLASRVWLARRADRAPDDSVVCAAIDAMVGISLGVLFDWAKHPQTDLAAALDNALAQLEAGLAF